MDSKISISEIFGPTLQGEGQKFGEPCIFIRTSGCNLRCEWTNKDGSLTKCDTPYTSWDPKDFKMMSIREILDEVDRLNVGHNVENIVISGGEPFLQINLIDLIDALHLDFDVTVETNGTIYRDNNACLISISPKLSSSISKSSEAAKKLHILNRIYDEKNITKFKKRNNIQVKFVYSCKEDLKEINEFVDKFGINKEDVYLMPQGEVSKTILENTKDCFDACVLNGYNMTHRLHILAYEDKREV